MIRLLKNIVLLAAGALTALGLRRPAPPAPAEAPPAEGEPLRPDRSDLKHRLIRLAKHFALFVVVLIVGGFLVAASGIVPIKASSGHWAITQWFLSFSMHRSVVTHTAGMTVPSLDEPRLVLKGAGHYDFGCRPCHGSPELPHPRVAQAMTPHPPYLPPEISKWEPEELFYIVKHGVKLTGMPAWPAQQRDDEVWAMVAFLRALPELDAEAYQRLAAGAAGPNEEGAPAQRLLGPVERLPVPDIIAESCARCHGVEGLGRGLGAFPMLAGQRPAYLHAALQAYARGERHSGIMEPIAAGLDAGTMRELARYYARLESPLPARQEPEDLAAIRRGERIAQRGVPSQGVPSCSDCHGPGTAPRNPFYPALAGQYADYLVLQLELFKQEHRGGSAYAHLMRPVAERLTPEQMRDVAAYYASLAPALDASVP